MRHVAVETPGGPEVLRVTQIGAPACGPGEVRIRVEAAGVSRADVMQRTGTYPPPPAASPILGLEVAGRIDEVGSGVDRWKRGDAVCALTNGGGYAELVAVPAGQVLPIPEGWNAVEAATLPENAFTVYDNLFTRARLRAGEMLLVHGGTSGIGTTAIMFAASRGAAVIATAGTDEKSAACVRLGAAHAINYRERDFVAEVKRLTQERGVDVVLDLVGGDYIARDIEALAFDGRIVCIATQRGHKVDLNLRRLFAKRAAIMASSLRPRDAEEKARIARALEGEIWPLLPARDVIVPLVDSVFSFDRAAEAHARMESSQHIGKIVLIP